MSKRIKKFREAWEDDEWGHNEERADRKKDKLKNRQQKRKEKFSERWFDEDFNLKRKK